VNVSGPTNYLAQMNIKKQGTILLTLLALSGCARAEGSSLNEPSELSEPSEVAQEAVDTQTITDEQQMEEDEPPIEFIPPDVDPDSIEPIINYVDALNIALTGDLFALRASALPGCGCLEIADRLAEIFPTQTLIGGRYQLKQIQLLNDVGFTKEFKVLISRSDIEKIDKQSRRSVVWSKSEISTIFIIKYQTEKEGGGWQLSDTR
jgi:hypothetical protein